MSLKNWFNCINVISKSLRFFPINEWSWNKSWLKDEIINFKIATFFLKSFQFILSNLSHHLNCHIKHNKTHRMEHIISLIFLNNKSFIMMFRKKHLLWCIYFYIVMKQCYWNKTFFKVELLVNFNIFSFILYFINQISGIMYNF